MNKNDLNAIRIIDESEQPWRPFAALVLIQLRLPVLVFAALDASFRWHDVLL